MLNNKIALVTGGGSGIGKAICLMYAGAGAKVVVADKDAKSGHETVLEIQAQGGTAIFIEMDASNPGENQLLVEKTLTQFGKLHIACNNAGIGGVMAPTAEYPVEVWDKVIATNLSGIFYGMRAQLPAILNSGGGSIINMDSILGTVATKHAAAYVAAKHGLVGLTKTTALEYADKNIRVNAIGPGYIITPLLTNTMDAATLQALAALHPMGRLGQPEEVAELALWLASAKSSFVTGAYYAVDGGYTAQ